MKTTIDLAPTLNFLGDLRQHNNRAWFEQNRPAYESARDFPQHATTARRAMRPFLDYLDRLP